MPAYRERVYLCPNENGQPGWILEFPIWWDRREFFQKYGERQIDTGHPFYVNYGILLTQGEALSWDKSSRDEFARDPCSKHAGVLEDMRLWDTRLKHISWMIVESYEWESGLS